ncbi:archaeal flagella-related protein I, predicted secretion ATPase [Thermococcus kodakarensis KOD1]|uniref:Archaeal flagella-related protein I, predicted secretion ATPase n=1 Tax=Thermococcus kodakarensis (strain ATCC BAA-918 / JCM 12380 / KOD1) TaxID=69014 RepID=Q5JEE4_THEKO|nr:type II/IV secretion system ATPase subunit [Thermococcus kodakarensis]WCN28164.1 type II/IV secretion system ATPase subunit [Thermococcus kodakarensis]WCN30462.1 type II/IV secretion system ATPase subunit [Thermococcus kodakarensis]BAD84237.1 archaeal flagella-related protein I, predicted secretion ATPase [Thermococcus kodakarensis KOD1]
MAQAVISDTLEDAMARNPHLRRYIEQFRKKYGKMPEFHAQLSRDMKDIPYPNILYPVGDPIFVHIYTDPATAEKRYIVIEPRIESAEEEEKYKLIKDKILELAPTRDIPEDQEEFERFLDALFDEAVLSLAKGRRAKFTITKDEMEKFRYLIKRDIIGIGPLEPIARDPYIEDIHIIGAHNVSLVHKIFEMMQTNIDFGDDVKLADYFKNMAERIGRPVSDRTPIVDGALPDGSRINIIYSPDISIKGPSATIRKFSATPISIVQLIGWGTLSAEVAAYLWIALEYGMSVFVCGETASGKTTLLNAIIPFIKPGSKIYTAEDTPEVQVPHPVWQRLITRERGPEESRVTLFDLLKAALRSRPNYIIVGEIRGAEGAIAFQAMQTGHPVMATFHAGDIKKMIQRFTGHPINVPITFIDNLNIAVFQQAVYVKGKFLRRTISVVEIEGYYEELGGVATRNVFEWDSVSDRHIFRGFNNSYILERKIAEIAGYEDPKDIYNELFLRARILQRMVELGITNYWDVYREIKAFYLKGIEGLSFRI